MVHPETFLMQKIIGYENNGLKSLAHLNADHVKDLAQVMQDFTERTVIEVIERLNAGENVRVGKCVLKLSKD